MNMDKTLYMMIGVMGSGKSTWVKEHQKQTGGVILSSDDLRIQEFGALEAGNTPQANKWVFSEIEKKLGDFYESDKTAAYFDATNLSRKRRIPHYTRSVKRGVKVVAVVILKPFDTLIQVNKNRELNKQGTEEVIERQYTNFIVPRIGVDCDEMIVYGKFSDFEDEINRHMHLPHDNPFHKETLQEHIDLTVQNSDNDTMREIATYHDLGKSIARKQDTMDRPAKNYFRELNGSYYRYIGHEKVSGMYYLAYLNETNQLKDPSKLQILEVINQHMQAHRGISQKVINRDKLTEQDLSLIEEFRVIDNKSKVVEQDILDEFFRIQDEDATQQG